jgi:cytochrome P450
MHLRDQEVEIDTANESENPFEFLLTVTQRYGDVVKYTGPLGTTYLFNHPDHIKQILQNPQFHRTSLVKIVLGEGLLSSDGDYWKKQRGRAQSFFHRDALAKLEPVVQARTRTMLEQWAHTAECGESFDVAAEMTRLTLTVIVDVLFGVNLQTQIRELGEALDVLLNDLGAMGCTQLNTPLTFSASGRERFQSALATLDRIVRKIIEDRRRADDNPANFLSFILSVRDEETGARLSDRQLRDEVVTMLIAGHETTSLILSWAWNLLAENPDCERSLHQELDTVLGSRLPKFEDLDQLPYALMVLKESMRLYPPVWFIARKTMFACNVGGCHVPDNTLVVVSPYAIHRHPEFWLNPGEFDPVRFSPGSQQLKYSYIPFGGGPHLCLGMNMALMEGHLILASIAQKFRVRPVPGRVVEPQPAITLRLRDGLVATLSERVPKRSRKMNARAYGP